MHCIALDKEAICRFKSLNLWRYSNLKIRKLGSKNKNSILGPSKNLN
jgi:hypothetical protein